MASPLFVRPLVRRIASAGAFCAGIALVLAPGRVAADQPPPCDAWEVEYALSANLELSDTPMKQGDGVYPVGPGTVVLRFDDHGGQPAGRVKMLSYAMKQSITVVSNALFFKTTVVTDALTRAAPDPCGVAAEGVLTGQTLAWSGPVRSVRSDGTLNCDGSLCGKFGAPPHGQSALHIGPNAVSFQPFQFSSDLKTFAMASTFVSRTEEPKETAHVALSGRETRRSCVQVKACL
jgi:hypothetical protein